MGPWPETARQRGGDCGIFAAVRGINGLIKVVETLAERDQAELAFFNGAL